VHCRKILFLVALLSLFAFVFPVYASSVNNIVESYGIRVGQLQKGAKNTIADVAGVKVGHVTLANGDIQTGVTAVLPASDNLFRNKFIAGSQVINGFGKTTGLVQVNELGTIETPLILTNTLSIGDAWVGLVQYMLDQNPEIGTTTGTVNQVVFECNDSYLNDIRGRHIKPEHVKQAIEAASEDFEQGAVGAGRGMSCYQFKGGIGSSSRIVETPAGKYTVGVLVQTNFGSMKDLKVNGEWTGEAAVKIIEEEKLKEQGSCIVIIATDAPMTARQLHRLSLRASVGISRTGAYISNGSGEIALAFSTAQRIPHGFEGVLDLKAIGDDSISAFFMATAEATEEAILSSLLHAETVTGRAGNMRPSLASFAGRVPGISAKK
jgi:D-aminopeptidase